MITQSTNLKTYRKKVDVPLSDVAYLLQMDPSNLQKVEHGLRIANPHVVMLYHILFKVPLTKLFAQQYQEQCLLWQRRGKALIEQLQKIQSSKSNNTVAYLRDFVNSLDLPAYDR